MLCLSERPTPIPSGLTQGRRISSTWASRGLSSPKRSSALRCGEAYDDFFLVTPVRAPPLILGGKLLGILCGIGFEAW